jgi:sugar/nucleoside kinase (ribokinase family)
MSELASAHVDILFPNLEEGTAMTGKDSPRAIAAALRAVVPIVALKLGADGCLLSWGDQVEHVPAEPARVIDTTGAGDAFAAAFAVEHVRTGDPRGAARAGAVAAAAAVARMGSR